MTPTTTLSTESMRSAQTDRDLVQRQSDEQSSSAWENLSAIDLEAAEERPMPRQPFRRRSTHREGSDV